MNEVVSSQLLRDWPLPDVDDDGGKSARGTVVVIGGAIDTPGAVLLAGLAALRVGAGKLTLRTAGSPGARPPQSTEIATLIVDGELLTATAGGWASIAVPNVGRLLRGRRWTIDTRRGRIVVER